MRQHDIGTNLLWFVAGLGVGAAVGLIVAPAPGVVTRRQIGDKANEARDFVADSGREYFDKGRELYERGLSLADEAAEMFDEGRRLVEGKPVEGGHA